MKERRHRDDVALPLSPSRWEGGRIPLAGLALLLALTACSDSKSGQAMAVLVDVSGTYADQKPQVLAR